MLLTKNAFVRKDACIWLMPGRWQYTMYCPTAAP